MPQAQSPGLIGSQCHQGAGNGQPVRVQFRCRARRLCRGCTVPIRLSPLVTWEHSRIRLVSRSRRGPLGLPDGKGIRSRVRFWERTGSGGTRSGAFRSGHRARLGAFDVQERPAAGASSDCALSSHRGGQGFKSPQLHPEIARLWLLPDGPRLPCCAGRQRAADPARPGLAAARPRPAHTPHGCVRLHARPGPAPRDRAAWRRRPGSLPHGYSLPGFAGLVVTPLLTPLLAKQEPIFNPDCSERHGPRPLGGR